MIKRELEIGERIRCISLRCDFMRKDECGTIVQSPIENNISVCTDKGNVLHFKRSSFPHTFFDFVENDKEKDNVLKYTFVNGKKIYVVQFREDKHFILCNSDTSMGLVIGSCPQGESGRVPSAKDEKESVYDWETAQLVLDFTNTKSVDALIGNLEILKDELSKRQNTEKSICGVTKGIHLFLTNLNTK